MLARVSNIETYRRWRLEEDATPADLVSRLTADQPTERMEVGTAFHKALELAQSGDHDELTANGYRFLFAGPCAIALPSVRELRCSRQYGPLIVSGQVDAIHGLRVEDHKTTANFSADSYLEGCQWRFYLDIFGADVFRWNVFEILADRKDPHTYHVDPPHLLEQFRYPGLHDDCMALALGYYEFATKHLLEAA